MTTTIQKLPEAAYLRECFSYDQNTGELSWRERPIVHFSTKNRWSIWRNRCLGKSVGSISGNGYIDVGFDGRVYRAHRLIWKITTGKEPPIILDHIDGNRANNRWNNLRAASTAQSMCNTKIRVNNTSGIRGVSPHQGKWMALIAFKRERRYLGVFGTKEEAHIAYQAAARELHGNFCRE